MTSLTGEDESRSQEEFISLYDLLEWAKNSYSDDLAATTYDLISILDENSLSADVYKYFDGIKPRTVKAEKTLRAYLLDINDKYGYDMLPF